MTRWLDPVRRALDSASKPVAFFFRDDDAGWGDDRLLDLLDLCARFRAPLDLAVIPEALGPELASKLRARAEADPSRVGLHQHGFAHRNHELDGRPCEFGPRRSPPDQRADIDRGRKRLTELLGSVVQPIFTPPWNRCTADTVRALADLGFRVLSRDATAPRLAIPGLLELPIHFDWFARRHGVRLHPVERGRSLAAVVAAAKPVGLMFHHAIMDADERAAAAELLALLATHPNARCQSMWATAVAPEPLHLSGVGP